MKRWEAGATAGLIDSKPDDNATAYQDNWYGQGRYAGSIAYYWSRHLKTEFEYAWSGEGTRYFQDSTRIGGMTYYYPVESFHQLQQTSLRMVWQFRENAWVHPYVSAGAVIDAERRHFFVPPIYPPGGRGSEPIPVGSDLYAGRRTEIRGGVTVGGGAKFYMTKNAFFNTGASATYAKPAATLNVIAGFGIEF